ncbi:peptidase domain-containing ABC transporter [Pedobacter sp. PWIIR3]
MKFTLYKQHDQMDCGPTCLRMVARYYGKSYSLQRLREYCQISREGVSLLGISEASEKIGFKSLGVKLSLSQLKEIELPCILHWRHNHFVVLFKIKNGKYHVADPSEGILVYSELDFKNNWINTKELHDGISLVLTPTHTFYKQEEDKSTGVKWSFLFKYLYTYRKLIIQLLMGMGVGSLLQLIAPFLTQAMVDVGINGKNIDFIYVILFAQIMFFLGNMSVEFIKSWIILHITTRINISILSDFLIKLMRLPMVFFDTKMTGDILQRMGDQGRIQNFLTGSSLSIVFSAFNLVTFSVVLVYYDAKLFMVFLISSTLYAGWILLFLKTRRELDNKNFELSSSNQDNTIQLINGMQEIKLNNCEQKKRWEWEHIQASLFKFRIKSMALGQYQQAGSMFINQGKNILITFLSAKSVIDGDLTLGGMMAVQYIFGQLNSPIEQFLGFIQSFQDAKISLERLNEIHEMEDEEIINKTYQKELPKDRSISISNLTFTYPGAGNESVLRDIEMYIPAGKTTAIVGMSGSGKTTILKLLMRFYKWEKGEIRIGNLKLADISYRTWRSRCGIVTQDGYIFSDNIVKNIAVGDENPDKFRLEQAIRIANIEDFISGLPNGLATKLGASGNGISQGQKQRILIARAVYKDPDYIFFDEATNALDANNESIIMNNLQQFFNGRTVVIVAHRLSTVSNADNIIVMESGEIVEQGTHDQLIYLKGSYFGLVKNQLELGL